ncbi:MAG: polyprenyl synthetase family protein [Oscillospiraceae bacterium]|nr:polyprenyl synthetase family protein [Oscillospiraceae bacterium]
MNDVKLQLKCYAERLETYMIAKVALMQSSTTMELDTLYDAMRHSLSAGGKRIRPVLIYEFCKICGGQTESADAAACAMEMTHTSSLIFDDLPAMDDDDLRRGKPSCHKAFGEATAILAGDALICAPFMILANDPQLTAEQKVALISVLSEREGANGMVGGQLMDMSFETQEQVSAEDLTTMCLGKTGALMEASCKMGCICGGGSPEQQEAAAAYGRSIGLAFQIIDDILDVTSTAELLGKPIGSDASEEKKTFVTVLGIEEARKKAAELTAFAHAQLELFENTEFLHALTDELLVRVQ